MKETRFIAVQVDKDNLFRHDMTRMQLTPLNLPPCCDGGGVLVLRKEVYGSCCFHFDVTKVLNFKVDPVLKGLQYFVDQTYWTMENGNDDVLWIDVPKACFVNSFVVWWCLSCWVRRFNHVLFKAVNKILL